MISKGYFIEAGILDNVSIADEGKPKLPTKMKRQWQLAMARDVVKNVPEEEWQETLLDMLNSLGIGPDHKENDCHD